MRKQTFHGVKKALIVLLLVSLVVSLTATSVSALSYKESKKATEKSAHCSAGGLSYKESKIAMEKGAHCSAGTYWNTISKKCVKVPDNAPRYSYKSIRYGYCETRDVVPCAYCKWCLVYDDESKSCDCSICGGNCPYLPPK